MDDSHEFDSRLGRVWRDHHRYLLNLAFRVLGSVSEAEDAVQEAFARLVDHSLDEIDDVRGWLAVVVSRLCFDQLRSADRQRRSSTTLHTLEPPPARDMDPADRITLDDEVRLALHIVITQLTPAERTAFVLHDVFSYSFDTISEILGRSPAACRQLASRARRTINPNDTGRFTVEATDAHRVAEQFIAACSTGDFEGMLAVMDPDCSGHVDTGAAVGELVDLPRLGILVGLGGILLGPTMQMTVADRARSRYLTLLANDEGDRAQLRTAARAVTLLNGADIAILLIIVWVMYAKPDV